MLEEMWRCFEKASEIGVKEEGRLLEMSCSERNNREWRIISNCGARADTNRKYYERN